MTALSRVADIESYLADTDWKRLPEDWRGASIWTNGGREVLVPGNDEMCDGELRIREIMDILTELEQRPRAEITRDINSPLTDVQTYRTFPTEQPAGMTSLLGGLNALRGIHDILAAAARVVQDGPHYTLPPQEPENIEEFLRTVQLGPALTGSYMLAARVPVDQAKGRELGQQLYDAVIAVQEAVTVDDETAFDDTVTAGVSAELCTALGLLAEETEPFEISFRWARGRRSELPARAVTFAPGAVTRIRAAADRLRELKVRHEATVTGHITSLHGGKADRWRVIVRGELVTPQGTHNRRSVWVRFTDQRTYNRAVDAHRDELRVSATGSLANTDRRAELHIEPDGFHILG